ncbi:BrnA antitoxin family protein [Rhizobium leguminosarum]|nr:BrnA antitoxin family protein [Rhizobium leguminosarum]MBY2926356.1 BrnA antitoxin family protein [Rhizobium leguminosarum]MBY2933493.1 BrnA antitoxin family protein [Rhizobium leguminosarum]MBY2972192.1 BrnA antitoxin family protein [Rhizobium leguminosarum]MBY2979594.1 BrnA antitoxin family protein [Rhizobium leguminosarum]
MQDGKRFGLGQLFIRRLWALPELVESIRKNLGGRPKSINPKVAVSIRLDPQVVDAFTAKGEGWQSRINETLQKAIGL